MRRRCVVPALLAVCLGLLVSPGAVAAGPPGGRPTITITRPRDGAVIRGSTVTIHVDVRNFTLVPPILLPPAQWKTIPLLPGNQGHIHYVLDNISNLVMTRDVTTRLTHPWPDVAPGWHTVFAYLATSRHQQVPGTSIASARVYVPVSTAANGHARVRVEILPQTGGGVKTPAAPPVALFLAGLFSLGAGWLLVVTVVRRSRGERTK